MRKNIFLLSLILAGSVLLISCGDDNDDQIKKYQYEFIDQPLQGTIDGLAFTAGNGKFEESFFEEGQLVVEIFDEEETDAPCDVFGQDEVSVFFSIPQTVGLYELSFELSTFEGTTVTLYNPNNAQNIILTEGAIEILTITDTEITGQIDARMDDDNHVTGNFTAQTCVSEVF